MLSYNWKSQKLVKTVYEYLTKQNISVWMDIEGGIRNDMIRSMSIAVEEAVIVICFCTEEYQKSKNCKTELKYAYTLNMPIIPVICDKGYTGQQFRSVVLYLP